jgi:hypothetical protein
MSASLASLVGAIFAMYIVVGGAMVIMGQRKVGDILLPVGVLLIALAFLPSVTVSLIRSAFRLISPWWLIAIGAIVLVGLLLRRAE